MNLKSTTIFGCEINTNKRSREYVKMFNIGMLKFYGKVVSLKTILKGLYSNFFNEKILYLS